MNDMETRSNHAVLFGNGLLRANNNNIDWAEVLIRLAEKGNVIVDDQLVSKLNIPYPLIYEEIVTNTYISEINFKHKIAIQLSNLQSNSHLQRLAELPIDNFITTNYDFTLENTWGTHKKIQHKGHVEKYPIWYHVEVAGKNVWHIHGDVITPKNLIIGYNEYCGMITKITKYVNDPNKETNALPSWVEVMLHNDIHIIGLGLSFSEIDLWHLLTIRKRLINEDKIKNKIYFYEKHDKIEDENTKRRLFSLLGIDYVTIPSDNYDDFYESAIDRIRDIILH